MMIDHMNRPSKKARITVTLASEIVDEIDRAESNRSRFVEAAVVNELQRRRSRRLLESLRSPHPESLETVEEGLPEWFALGSGTDADDLLVRDGGRKLEWIAGRGWLGEEE